MSYALRTHKCSPTLDYAADLYGRTRQVAPYRRGLQQSASFQSFDESDVEDPNEPPPDEIRQWIRQQMLATIDRYAASGLFSTIELRTIRALWLDGRSLREVARAEGVTAEAVRARIEGNRKGQGGIQRKAPEFYRWWAFKQRRRRKGACNVARTSARSCSQWPTRQRAA